MFLMSASVYFRDASPVLNEQPDTDVLELHGDEMDTGGNTDTSSRTSVCSVRCSYLNDGCDASGEMWCVESMRDEKKVAVFIMSTDASRSSLFFFFNMVQTEKGKVSGESATSWK